MSARRSKGDRPGCVPLIGAVRSGRVGAGQKAVSAQIVETSGVIEEAVVLEVVVDEWLDGGGEEVRGELEESRQGGRKVMYFFGSTS